MKGATEPTDISTRQQQIAELAKRHPGLAFTSLNHHLDVHWLREAYRRTRKDGARGVDGVTAEQYERDLEGNLATLLERAKSGTYRAPPVRRVHIPKGSGSETRPIGIPTLEDKVLQRAIVMLLEPIYEHDFLSCSYGFRPGKSAHQALQAIWDQGNRRGGWVLDVDLRKFFDTLDHAHLRAIVEQRVRDGVVLRLIGKWLNAGVMEGGAVTHSATGTPQGGVISPLLANVYLHEVLDLWFERDVRTRLQGHAFMVRYADDFVMFFEREHDARRVLDVLPKRFEKYGLQVHPDKTRLVPFRRPSDDHDGPRPSHFDFLGFTHYWGQARSGRWVIKRKTAKGRLQRAIKAIWEWCRRYRHGRIANQHQSLNRKLTGHYAYYGITGNSQCLGRFAYNVTRAWRYWLNRRSQKANMTWVKFGELLKRWPLATPRIVHSVYAAKS
jgi:group II intron reverse transcriptase/maturase